MHYLIRLRLKKLTPGSNQTKYDWQALDENDTIDHNFKERIIIDEFSAPDGYTVKDIDEKWISLGPIYKEALDKVAKETDHKIKCKIRQQRVAQKIIDLMEERRKA